MPDLTTTGRLHMAQHHPGHEDEADLLALHFAHVRDHALAADGYVLADPHDHGGTRLNWTVTANG